MWFSSRPTNRVLLSLAIATIVFLHSPRSAGRDAVDVAMDQIGDPYVTNGVGPDEFDCSGLVTYSYGQVGISVPKGTSRQQSVGTSVAVSDIQRGDLLFFDAMPRLPAVSINHVGLATGNGTMVVAPDRGRTVQEVRLTAWWAARLMRVQRVAPQCSPNLAPPVLAYSGTEDYEVNGRLLTAYHLDVVNKGDFPDVLFEPSPGLPPCGLNSTASRSWVSVYVGGAYVYGFCGFTNAGSLGSIWFGLDRGHRPTGPVAITITDRKCGRTVHSNEVTIN